MATCPACGRESDADAKFCSSCGAALPEPKPEAPEPTFADPHLVIGPPAAAPAPPPATAPPPTTPSAPPAGAPVPPAPAKKSTWWYWACGGCGCLAILLAVVIGLVVWAFGPAKEAVEKAVNELETKTSEATSTSGPHVKSMRVGDVYDEQAQKVTSERAEFAPDSPEIHMDADLAGLTTGQKITATLIAVSVTDTEGNLLHNHQVASIDYEAPGPEPGIHAKFTPPDKGWPTGDYVIEVAVDGEKIQEAELTVAAGDVNEPRTP